MKKLKILIFSLLLVCSITSCVVEIHPYDYYYQGAPQAYHGVDYFLNGVWYHGSSNEYYHCEAYRYNGQYCHGDYRGHGYYRGNHR